MKTEKPPKPDRECRRLIRKINRELRAEAKAAKKAGA